MAQFFLTGTDTGVGKTLVAAALLHAAGTRALRTIGLKPVSAGCMQVDGRWVNDDALLLQATATERLDYALVNPAALRIAMAPHLAAAQEGATLSVASLTVACREAARKPHELLIAEGAGGWLVPLNATETMADLARSLAWPVLLVVGMRLGCLNHALLSSASIRAAGLRLAGWVANSPSGPGVPMHALAENIDALERRLDAPLLGTIPPLATPDIAAAAKHLHLERLPGLAARAT